MAEQICTVEDPAITIFVGCTNGSFWVLFHEHTEERRQVEGDLKKHTIIHYPEQQYTCFCGRRFARKCRYDNHIKQHNYQEKTIQCDICGEW
ncbi:hypothetical protein RR48_01504 [Papilio machaon]|uniref:C2H2-type domain-containing protein n=1 Tax=Papilio machaon TaxID=76193 RepID=A0A0N0PEN2_PAPMA|nr:hypothetical protein RR48_01504 [Papilio machaon]